MDNFDFEDVEFNPYNIVQEEGTEEVPSTSLATYYGPIWYPGGKLIYDPRRILRQMGIIQNVPRDIDNKYKLAPLGRSSNATQSTFGNWIPTFHPAPDYQTWTDRYDNLLPATVNAYDPALFDEGSYLKIVGNDEEQAGGYADWYAQQSHPLVINRAQQEIADAEEAEMIAEEAEREAQRQAALGNIKVPSTAGEWKKMCMTMVSVFN